MEEKHSSEDVLSEEAVSEETVSESQDVVEEKTEKKKQKKEKPKKDKKVKRSKKSSDGTPARRPEEVNIVKELLNLIIYIGIVVLLCFIIIKYVGCRTRVDGVSMYPTLEDGDNLWVDKLSYTFGKPKRFDVIIFNYDEDTVFVKRIIGLPGETVRIDQSGNIYINEQILEEDYGYETILPTNIGRASQPVVLGDDEYFVLGDNRNNSTDSRWSSVGNVSKDKIIGKAVLRFYPISKFGLVK